MSVPTNPQTFATCAMFFAERGTRPGVDTASQGRATFRTGSSGSLSRACAPAIRPPTATVSASRTILSRIASFLPESDVVERARADQLDPDLRGACDRGQERRYGRLG